MNDLISRQAAMDAIAKMMPRSYTPDGSHPADEEIFRAQEIFADCIEVIEIMPPVQPKRGKWIPVTNGRGGHECDQCHNYAPSYQNGKEHLSDFCPACGADMRTRTDCDYERAVEQLEYDALYEPTFNKDDGSM